MPLHSSKETLGWSYLSILIPHFHSLSTMRWSLIFCLWTLLVASSILDVSVFAAPLNYENSLTSRGVVGKAISKGLSKLKLKAGHFKSSSSTYRKAAHKSPHGIFSKMGSKVRKLASKLGSKMGSNMDAGAYSRSLFWLI